MMILSIQIDMMMMMIVSVISILIVMMILMMMIITIITMLRIIMIVYLSGFVGGNAKTLIILTVSSARSQLAESISTLRFGMLS
jgi:hypothetical protein